MGGWNVSQKNITEAMEAFQPPASCIECSAWDQAGDAAAVPPNFEDTFVTSVSGPTDLTWTRYGRMLIIGKGGQLRVYSNGALLPTPALNISARVCTVGEQGLESSFSVQADSEYEP